MSRSTCRTHHRTTRAALFLTSLALLSFPVVTASASTGAVRDAAPSAGSDACRAPVVGPAPATAPTPQPRLDGIRVGRHDEADFDRVVFDLTSIPGYRVHRVRKVIEDGSGDTLTLRGRSHLLIRLEPAVAHDDDGATAPRRIVRSFPQLRVVRRAGDFEGVVTYALGLRRTSDFRVSVLDSPARLLVDVAHRGAHPFDCRSGAVEIVLATTDATAASVTRRVPVPAVMHGAMTALYAGPADYDRPAGLTFVASDSSGFANLRLRNDIARVRLTGGCDSGGATFTVANEIMPTLKQFESVDFVKIYSPGGSTERPRGRSDSIPTCLEP